MNANSNNIVDDAEKLGGENLVIMILETFGNTEGSVCESSGPS